MRDLIAQHVGLAWVLVCVLIAIAVSPLILRRRRQARPRAAEPIATPASRPLAVVQPAKPDGAALAGAVRAAEVAGRNDELPGLYLSLAHFRIEAGSPVEAQELLRKSILGAAANQQKDVHARARLVLGDLAHQSGDHTTACEHWQIARALFHELNRPSEHEAAERRMLSNGCPTDWVLTDF